MTGLTQRQLEESLKKWVPSQNGSIFQTPYCGSARRVTLDTGPGLTEQCHKDKCDVNNILAKYQRTGVLEHANQHQGKYDNFIAVTDYHDSLNKILEAEQMFSSLPSSLRKEFNNNPADFLSFVSDDANADRMRELGLLPDRPASGSEAPQSDPEASAEGQNPES
jgi:phage internal scaffolding protein